MSHAPPVTGKLRTITCVRCGTVFAWARKFSCPPKYCSDECRRLAKNARAKVNA